MGVQKAALIKNFKEQFWNNSPIAIYVCDMEGFIVFFNEAACELWGRRPVVGKDRWCGFSKVYYADGIEVAYEDTPVITALESRSSETPVELTGLCADGTYKKVLAIPRKIYNENGGVDGVYNTLINIGNKDEMERRQAFLSSIVDSSNDAIISKNLEGIITSWNAGAEKIFGYKEHEITGKSVTTLIPVSRLSEEDHILSEIKKGNKVDHFQTIRLHRSGREIPISLTISPIKDGKGRIIGASKIARDISEQVQTQQSLALYIQNLETINELTRSISEKMDIQEILQCVTDATTKLTGAAFGAFFYNTIDEQGEAFMLFTLSGAPREAFERLGMPRNTEIFSPTFSGTAIVRSDNITKDKRFGKNAPHYGMPQGHLPVVSYLAVPVVLSHGHVIGGLFFGHPEEGKFTANHETIVGGIAAQAAIALDNSRLFEEVKALNLKKDEFIALASHELKTPLTTISGYLQIMEKKSADPLNRKFIDKAINQVERLNKLISDLLDISKIEAGKLIFNIEEFDLVRLVEDVIDNFRYTDSLFNISLKSYAENISVKADRHRIEQAISNLLSNAIKYSPDNFNIEIVLTRSDNSVQLTFKDRGIGLTPAQQSQIFSRFYRAEGTNKTPGLGLGLYITKEIVNRHGGIVGVVSEFGKGSEFYFTLSLT